MEAAMPDTGGRFVLAALSDGELYRLEAIVIARDAGTPTKDMPDDDLRFLASIRVLLEER